MTDVDKIKTLVDDAIATTEFKLSLFDVIGESLSAVEFQGTGQCIILRFSNDKSITIKRDGQIVSLDVEGGRRWLDEQEKIYKEEPLATEMD